MKFEALKDVVVLDGEKKITVRAGKSADSRDVGITDKSMAELQRGGFVHVEKAQGKAPEQPKVPEKEGK